MKRSYTGQRPILVTGAHRSGTTWVGKMLAAGGEAAYISEPLNMHHRLGVLRLPTHYWYSYISADNEAEYLPALLEMLSFRYHLGVELRSLRSLKDVLRMGRDWNIFTRGRIFHKRPLIKDPFAVFSAPWFAKRLNCQVVVTVRHPAAFVSSLKRLNWPFKFANLLDQPLLMRDWLADYRQEMESTSAEDTVTLGGLLWKMIYNAVSEYKKTNPDMLLVHHEELSIAPMEDFETVYQQLGLRFNSKAEQAILKTSHGKNPAEISKNSAHSIRVDSRLNLENWKRRLTHAEIDCVRAVTADVAGLFYPAASWE